MSNKPPPLQFGCYYHLYNRGINRENIFFEERNYNHFLKLYGHHFASLVDTYAYCLLKNHFHFSARVKSKEEIIQTPGVLDTPGVSEDSITPEWVSHKFGNVLNAYAKAINKAYDRTGSLFQQRFGRVQVTSNSHLLYLVRYIHRNPQKHGFVKDFRDWPYSSFHALASNGVTRLDRNEVLSWFGDKEDFQRAHMNETETQPIAYLIADDFD